MGNTTNSPRVQNSLVLSDLLHEPYLKDKVEDEKGDPPNIFQLQFNENVKFHVIEVL